MSTMKTTSATYTVYHGPGTAYKNMGSVSRGETVTCIWHEGSYTHIEYTVTSTGKKKRGYVSTSSINITESGLITITNSNADRYVNTSVKAYLGPGTSYTEADFALPKGLKLKYVGQKPSNYAYVEFSDPSTAWGSTAKKMRAYIDTIKLSTSVVSPVFYSYSGNSWTTSSPWRNQNSSSGNYKGHLGNDLVKSGTKIKALADGVVYSKSASNLTYNGYTITLLHAIGDRFFFSFYAHMDSAPSLSAKAAISAGGDIHNYGSSGNVTGAHLHLGVYCGTQTDNQSGYRKVSGVNTDFDDGGTGAYVYNNTCFFDSHKVVSTNGSVIANK